VVNAIGIRSTLDNDNVASPATITVVPGGVSSCEVIEDHCIICDYFHSNKQRVKECEWTEGTETFSAPLCKPCYISLQSIELGGSL